MASLIGMRRELDAGFHSSVDEAHNHGIGQDLVTEYVRTLNIDYSQANTLADVGEALEADKPAIDPAPECLERQYSEEEMAQLIADDDLSIVVRAEKDAASAEAEASIFMARLDRFMDTARVLNSMTIESERGE